MSSFPNPLTTVGGDTFDIGFEGQVIDEESSQIDSFTNTGSLAMDFGVLAVRDTSDRTCKQMAADADLQLGIVVRNPLRPASTDGNNTVTYKQYDSVPVLRDGVIVVRAAEAVRRGDQVLALTAGGAGNTSLGSFGGSKGGAAAGGRVDVPNAVWEDTVASGALGRIRIKTVGTRRTTT